MKAETQQIISQINSGIDNLKKHVNWDQALFELKSLDEKAENPNLWSDPQNAQNLLKKREKLSREIKKIEQIESEFSSFVDLLELAELESDAETQEECENNIEQLGEMVSKLELETLLSCDADANNCFLEVNAGAGGTEAQDWAEMLGRMYARWADSKQYKTNIIDENPGDEAGIKSITLKITGHQAYGWLKSESGVHRLVRISPFDSNSRRHTSFASVWVYPEIDDSIDINIEEKDLRIDTYRASGAGGQHVNKTESAIRITHLPTNVVVQCQNDRSQHKNRAQALNMLKARLYEIELRKKRRGSKCRCF